MAGILADILEVNGLLFNRANSGEEALEILSDHRIEILLKDVRMPDMNGVDTMVTPSLGFALENALRLDEAKLIKQKKDK